MTNKTVQGVTFGAATDKETLEKGSQLTPRWDANGLIPAIATDAETGAVLMLAWMNAEALARTLQTGDATYYSRSRQEIWIKGATSGNTQKVVDIRIDCDQDAIWMSVEQQGPACHTGKTSCFYRRIEKDGTLSLAE